MKKYITLLIAVAITSSFAFAVDGERPERHKRPTLAEQIERIGGILENEDISDRKKAYLENRLAVMEIQSVFRDKVQEAIADLGEGATEEDRHDAMRDLRDNFKEELDGLKVNRRALFDGRRELRKKASEETEVGE
jgi:hypothetical protein